MSVPDRSDSNVFVDLRRLMKLEHQGRGFSFLPRQPNHSVLAGTHGSRLRGRGLDFLEMRSYQPGDDVRTIDWHATARQQKPYVRVFTEERERPVLLLVDQRRSMFFGSVLKTKAVTAAEVAALTIWRILHAHDRAGAIVFTDGKIECFRPQRSRATAMQILAAIAEMNRSLQWKSAQEQQPSLLNEALNKARRFITHDYLVIEITDGAGADEGTRRHNTQIAQHNDIIFAHIYDPLECDLPAAGGLAISDGNRQVELSNGHALRAQFRADREAGINDVRSYWSQRQMPVLSISCAEETAPQLRRLLTTGARGAR